MTRKFDFWGAPVALKAGGTVNDMVRDSKYGSVNTTYAGPDGILATGDESMGLFLDKTNQPRSEPWLRDEGVRVGQSVANFSGLKGSPELVRAHREGFW